MIIFCFYGINCKGNRSKYRNVKRNIKYKSKLYANNKIPLCSLISTIMCYKSHYPNMFKNDLKF